MTKNSLGGWWVVGGGWRVGGKENPATTGRKCKEIEYGEEKSPSENKE